MNDSHTTGQVRGSLFGGALTCPEKMLVHHAPGVGGQIRSGQFSLTASTVDGVGVGGSSSFVNDGVQTCEGSAVVAGHAPESVGRAGQHSCRGDGCDRLHG